MTTNHEHAARAVTHRRLRDAGRAFQGEVGEWADATFAQSTPESIAAHMRRETAEVGTAVARADDGLIVAEEAADVYLTYERLPALDTSCDHDGGPMYWCEDCIRTPDDWLATAWSAVRVIRREGWCGPDGRPWSDPITYTEMQRRLANSTLSLRNAAGEWQAV